MSNENKPRVPGRAAGGYARASSLSSKERSQAAKEAAQARWLSPDLIKKAEFGSPDKPLRIVHLEIPCYVLEDGTRVLVQSGMLEALNLSPGGSGGSGGDRLAKFFSGKKIGPFVSEEILGRANNPIKFKLPTGNLAYGYEAKMLPDICDAVLEARSQGRLQPQQLHIAKQCEILVRGFATVGIIALVDEATGYQEIRDRQALQIILEKYVTDEWAKWTKVFPDEYYKQLFRLKNMAYPPLTRNKPSYIGHWTNNIVYSRLAPGVLQELQKLNPRGPSGNRSRKFHQHLTTEVGNPELKKHLENVVFLMKASSNWQEFERMLNKAAPKLNSNMQLDLNYKEAEG